MATNDPAYMNELVIEEKILEFDRTLLSLLSSYTIIHSFVQL